MNNHNKKATNTNINTNTTTSLSFRKVLPKKTSRRTKKQQQQQQQKKKKKDKQRHNNIISTSIPIPSFALLFEDNNNNNNNNDDDTINYNDSNNDNNVDDCNDNVCINTKNIVVKVSTNKEIEKDNLKTMKESSSSSTASAAVAAAAAVCNPNDWRKALEDDDDEIDDENSNCIFLQSKNIITKDLKEKHIDHTNQIIMNQRPKQNNNNDTSTLHNSKNQSLDEKEECNYADDNNNNKKKNININIKSTEDDTNNIIYKNKDDGDIVPPKVANNNDNVQNESTIDENNTIHISESMSNSDTIINDEEKNLNNIHNELLKQAKKKKSVRIEPPSPHDAISSVTPKDVSDTKDTNETASKPKKQRTTKRARSKMVELCALCSTCSCSKSNINGKALQSLENNAIQEDKNPLSLRARSDFEVEKALIGRLGRLEKSASYFDHLCCKVSNELNNLRKKIRKTREDGDKSKEKAWFLHDVHDDSTLHEELLHKSTKFSNKMVKKATTKTFAFRRKRQPTLTQMLGNDNDESSVDDEEMSRNCDDLNECSIIEEIDDPSKEEQESTEKINVSSPSSSVVRINESIHNCTEVDKNELHSEIFLDYEMALSRGKGKSLYHLSHVNKRRFDQVEHISCDTIMPLEDVDFDNYKDDDGDVGRGYDQYRDEILEILNMNENGNENDEMRILIDMFLQEVIHEEESDSSNIPPRRIRQTNNIDDNEEKVDKEESDSFIIHHPTILSQLSQRTRDTFHQLKSNVINSPRKNQSIPSICPNWEENIVYAFQQNESDISDALQKVRLKRARVKQVKEMILNKVQAMDSALDLFESALTKSLSRHEEKKKVKTMMTMVEKKEKKKNSDDIIQEQQEQHPPSVA